MLQFPLFSLEMCYLIISDGQEETKVDGYLGETQVSFTFNF